ncbi:hypothetical protein [Cupriavidus sp. YAF13]|uniref:hypothetical protein n=1 Tax=Cupriavidus sp. YAF13 TaxID=3233075 RepID=UPI003F93A23D
MTDLNLIEAAARAAGYEVRRYRVREQEVVQVTVGDDLWAQYDPLHWHGDAFRLQIACGLTVKTGPRYATAIAWPGGGALIIIEPVGDDPEAATRLAITCAAEALYLHRQAKEPA